MAKTKATNNTRSEVPTNNLEELESAIQQISTYLIKSKERERSASYRPVSELGAIVREARKSQKITLKVLVALSGVSLGTVQRIEKGQPTVSLESLIKVLSALGKKLWIQ